MKIQGSNLKGVIFYLGGSKFNSFEVNEVGMLGGIIQGFRWVIFYLCGYICL